MDDEDADAEVETVWRALKQADEAEWLEPSRRALEVRREAGTVAVAVCSPIRRSAELRKRRSPTWADGVFAEMQEAGLLRNHLSSKRQHRHSLSVEEVDSAFKQLTSNDVLLERADLNASTSSTLGALTDLNVNTCTALGAWCPPITAAATPRLVRYAKRAAARQSSRRTRQVARRCQREESDLRAIEAMLGRALLTTE